MHVGAQLSRQLKLKAHTATSIKKTNKPLFLQPLDSFHFLADPWEILKKTWFLRAFLNFVVIQKKHLTLTLRHTLS